MYGDFMKTKYQHLAVGKLWAEISGQEAQTPNWSSRVTLPLPQTGCPARDIRYVHPQGLRFCPFKKGRQPRN